MPITKVDQNYENAYWNDAINKQKFWWRINCFNNIDLTNDNFDFKEFNKNTLKDVEIVSISIIILYFIL